MAGWLQGLAAQMLRRPVFVVNLANPQKSLRWRHSISSKGANAMRLILVFGAVAGLAACESGSSGATTDADLSLRAGFNGAPATVNR